MAGILLWKGFNVNHQHQSTNRSFGTHKLYRYVSGVLSVGFYDSSVEVLDAKNSLCPNTGFIWFMCVCVCEICFMETVPFFLHHVLFKHQYLQNWKSNKSWLLSLKQCDVLLCWLVLLLLLLNVVLNAQQQQQQQQNILTIMIPTLVLLKNTHHNNHTISESKSANNFRFCQGTCALGLPPDSARAIRKGYHWFWAVPVMRISL